MSWLIIGSREGEPITGRADAPVSSPRRGEGGAQRRMRGPRSIYAETVEISGDVAPSSDPSGHLLPAGEKKSGVPSTPEIGRLAGLISSEIAPV